jgi:hypothetical protein
MIASTWVQPKYPLTREWMSTSRYTLTMEYYSAAKRNELLIHPTKWTNLKIITQRKRPEKKVHSDVRSTVPKW